MDTGRRNNVTVAGNPQWPVVVLAPGFGCDQRMWRLTPPPLDEDYRVGPFGHVGSGHWDLPAFSEDRRASLDGCTRDGVEICAAVDLRDAAFVGHSVSAMVGVPAARMAPERIGALVMVTPSPRYIYDEGCRGGFAAENGENAENDEDAEIAENIDELSASLESNRPGRSAAVAPVVPVVPVVMGNAERPEPEEEPTNSFCATDPDMVHVFARTPFLPDSRGDVLADSRGDLLPQPRGGLKSVDVPTPVLDRARDANAPREVGGYGHGAIPGPQLTTFDATGHGPHQSAPRAVNDPITPVCEGLR
ncbi:alpha/beta hydrolase [Streptomyces sp. MBT27]|uniref:alpha/beta fold hydrolase n=1 Tax=Streptomyces sp. MBT27 TaxID=1488356 RepID=UPI001420BAAE|nr:alpha/beta hydrolase [Streptomyces sp. MBT27]